METPRNYFICITCEARKAEYAIEAMNQLYANMKRLLMLLKTEESQYNKAVKDLKLFISIVANSNLSRQKKSFEYFLKKGKTFLDLAKNLHKNNQRISTMFGILLKNMKKYSKMKIKLRKIQYKDYWLHSDFVSTDESLIDKEYYLIPEQNRQTCRVYYFDLDEDNSIRVNMTLLCNSCQVPYREFLLAKIEMVIRKIRTSYVSFAKNTAFVYRTLYRKLKHYYKKARLFLGAKKKILQSSKPHRQSSSLRDVCYWYHLNNMLKHIKDDLQHIANLIKTR